MVKNSKIYVNKFELKTAKSRCQNQTELARALMKSVFTDEALKKCSLTGQRAKGTPKTEIGRPGLDEKCVNAILGKMNYLIDLF